MGEQVLGGGVIFLVAVVLWLAYLLPSWHSRHQYEAAERNAVRLNQALRVLAETSETPDVVRAELSARSALTQHKLARKALNEREHAEAEAHRRALAVEKEQARALVERARLEELAAKHAPEARRSRAQRRLRIVIGILIAAAAGFAAWGGVLIVQGGSQVVLWSGVGVAALFTLVLRRMAVVQRRAAVRLVGEAPQERVARPLQEVELEEAAAPTWTPRTLPRPLSASAGSRAAAVLDGAAARDALRTAVREEELRERAARLAPTSLVDARRVKATELPREAASDDARIEAHVRDLLERRASGQ